MNNNLKNQNEEFRNFFQLNDLGELVCDSVKVKFKDIDVDNLVADNEVISNIVETNVSITGFIQATGEVYAYYSSPSQLSMTGLKDNINDAFSMISSNTSLINGVSADVSSNTSLINNLTGEVNQNTSDIGSALIQISQLNQKVDTNTTGISQLNLSVSSNSSLISGLATSLSNLSGEVSQNIIAIAENTNDIITNSNSISALDGRTRNQSSSGVNYTQFLGNVKSNSYTVDQLELGGVSPNNPGVMTLLNATGNSSITLNGSNGTISCLSLDTPDINELKEKTQYQSSTTGLTKFENEVWVKASGLDAPSVLLSNTNNPLGTSIETLGNIVCNGSVYASSFYSNGNFIQLGVDGSDNVLHVSTNGISSSADVSASDGTHSLITTSEQTALNTTAISTLTTDYNQVRSDLDNWTLNVKTLYVNNGENTLKDAIDSLNSGVVQTEIKIGSGSYSSTGETILIDGKSNININGPYCPVDGANVLIYDPIAISGANTTRIRFSCLQLEGAVNISASEGRILFDRCHFDEQFILSGSVGNWITFTDCSFQQGIVLNNTFAGVCFFYRCNFNGVNPTFNQASGLQAQFADCLNWFSFPSASQATLASNQYLYTGTLRLNANEIYKGGQSLTGLPSGENGDYCKYSGGSWIADTIGASDLPSGINVSKLANGSVSNAEFQYLDGLTSSVQNQIDGKVNKNGDTMTGTLNGTSISLSNNLSVSGSTNLSGDLVLGGNLTVNGSTITANSNITVYDYIEINQNPADGSHPALSITQGGTASGPIVSVVDSDNNQKLEINQGCDFALNTNKFTIQNSSGNTGIGGTLNVSGSSTLNHVNLQSLGFNKSSNSTGSVVDLGNATTSLIVPKGSTAQRPTGIAGMIRYNESNGEFEGYTSEWGAIGGGGGSFEPTITSPVIYDMLYYNGSAWINGFPTLAPSFSLNATNKTITITSSFSSLTPFGSNVSNGGYQYQASRNSNFEPIEYFNNSTSTTWVASSLTEGETWYIRIRARASWGGVNHPYGVWSSTQSFVPIGDKIRQVLTTSLSAYDSAPTNGVVQITAQEYAAVVANISGTVEAGVPDSYTQAWDQINQSYKANNTGGWLGLTTETVSGEYVQSFFAPFVYAYKMRLENVPTSTANTNMGLIMTGFNSMLPNSAYSKWNPIPFLRSWDASFRTGQYGNVYYFVVKKPTQNPSGTNYICVWQDLDSARIGGWRRSNGNNLQRNVDTRLLDYPFATASQGIPFETTGEFAYFPCIQVKGTATQQW